VNASSLPWEVSSSTLQVKPFKSVEQIRGHTTHLWRPLGQKGSHITSMNGRPVPNHQDVPPDVTQQVFEKDHAVGAGQRFAPDHGVRVPPRYAQK
jgi:hypothetical protein